MTCALSPWVIFDYGDLGPFPGLVPWTSRSIVWYPATVPLVGLASALIYVRRSVRSPASVPARRRLWVFVPFAVLALVNLVFWARLMYLLRFTETFDTSIGVPLVATLAPIVLSISMAVAALIAAAIESEHSRPAER